MLSNLVIPTATEDGKKKTYGGRRATAANKVAKKYIQYSMENGFIN